MTTTPQIESRDVNRETALKAHLREEMDAGVDAARDPTNADLPDLYARQTTIYSSWYNTYCPECKHKFREGDRVRLCPQCGQAYHDDAQYGLHCWRDRFAEGGVCREDRYDRFADVFQAGCDYRWPGTFPDEADQDESGATKKAPLSSRRVSGVTAHFLRGLEAVWSPYGEETILEVEIGSSIVGHKCPWCRFQIRAGDRVVKCPCDNCNTYFHDDIFRHLTCWNEWNGSQGNDFCPTTGAKIEREAVPAEGSGDEG